MESVVEECNMVMMCETYVEVCGYNNVHVRGSVV